MKPNSYIIDLENCKLLTGAGHALDLGCGNGRDSLYLAGKGYKVTCVDKNESDLPGFIQSDIFDFEIDKNKYAIIVANNSLPFINKKEKVKEVINRMTEGLIPKGVLCFTIFGSKDAWSSKENMSFWTPEEISDLESSLSETLDLFHKTEDEGYGLTMKGDIKYWHVYRFTYTKK